MRIRSLALLAGVALALFGCGNPTKPKQMVTGVSVAAENAKPGDASWQIDFAGADDAFAAYARPLSLRAGERVDVQVQVGKAAAVSWAIYRLGDYGGAGARQIAAGGPEPAVPQPDPFVDPTTGLVECRWSSLFHATVGDDWLSGIYVARVALPDGGARYAYFIVRDERPADVVMVMPTATDEAYNDYGGESLYVDSRFHFPVGHAYQVSYDRPFTVGLGGGYLLTDALPAARYLEANGYDVTYLADHDVARTPSPLERAKLVLAVAHDEYWTRTMRDHYEAAREKGVSLGFLGANSGYWQVRLEPAGDGMADRRQTGYKEAAELDPLRHVDDANVTGAFQGAVLKRPENSLLGIMSVDWHVVDFPWVVKDEASWVYGGMNVHSGDLFAGVVGIESDGVIMNGAEPSSLTVVADSPDIGGEATGLNHQQATVYQTAAGGFVFAAGSIRFPATLAGGRAQLGAQRIVRNLIAKAGGAPGGPENTLGATDGFAGADWSGAAHGVSTLAGSTAGFADGAGSAAKFLSPMGLALAPGGALIVADAENHRVRQIAADAAHTVTTLAGSDLAGEDDGPARGATFRAPWGVAVGADGTVWVTDPKAHKVRRIAADGTVSTVAGTFGAPAGITSAADGSIYFTDLVDGSIRKIDGSGQVSTFYGGAALHYPTGIFSDLDGIWVLDSGNRVVRKVITDGSIFEFAGSQEGGFADGPGDRARLAPLLGVAKLGGALLVSDAGNYRVRRIELGADLASSTVRSFAGAPRLGRADGAGRDAGLVAPTGLAVDAARNLVYVADTGNALIRVITP